MYEGVVAWSVRVVVGSAKGVRRCGDGGVRGGGGRGCECPQSRARLVG